MMDNLSSILSAIRSNWIGQGTMAMIGTVAFAGERYILFNSSIIGPSFTIDRFLSIIRSAQNGSEFYYNERENIKIWVFILDIICWLSVCLLPIPPYNYALLAIMAVMRILSWALLKQLFSHIKHTINDKNKNSYPFHTEINHHTDKKMYWIRDMIFEIYRDVNWWEYCWKDNSYLDLRGDINIKLKRWVSILYCIVDLTTWGLWILTLGWAEVQDDSNKQNTVLLILLFTAIVKEMPCDIPLSFYGLPSQENITKIALMQYALDFDETFFIHMFYGGDEEIKIKDVINDPYIIEKIAEKGDPGKLDHCHNIKGLTIQNKKKVWLTFSRILQILLEINNHILNCSRPLRKELNPNTKLRELNTMWIPLILLDDHIECSGCSILLAELNQWHQEYGLQKYILTIIDNNYYVTPAILLSRNEEEYFQYMLKLMPLYSLLNKDITKICMYYALLFEKGGILTNFYAPVDFFHQMIQLGVCKWSVERKTLSISIKGMDNTTDICFKLDGHLYDIRDINAEYYLNGRVEEISEISIYQNTIRMAYNLKTVSL